MASEHENKSKHTEDKRNVLALFMSAASGDIDTIKDLVAAGVDVNVTDYDKRTALHIAASEGHLGVLELLLLAKANVHLEDRWQKTALAAAVEFKQEAAVQLLKTHGAVLNENDKASLALLLCEAASKNDLDAIKRLSLSGVSVSVSDYDKRTPLHIAAAEGHLECCKLLLLMSANPLSEDRWGNTPIDDASHAGHDELVSFLSFYCHIDKSKESPSTSTSTSTSSTHNNHNSPARTATVTPPLSTKTTTPPSPTASTDHEAATPSVTATASSSTDNSGASSREHTPAEHSSDHDSPSPPSLSPTTSATSTPAATKRKLSHSAAPAATAATATLLEILPSRSSSANSTENDLTDLESRSSTSSKDSTGHKKTRTSSLSCSRLDKCPRIKYAELDMEVQLGKGTYGVIFKAKYKNQPVAVKRIDISLNKDGKPDRKTKTAIKMFKREVDALWLLREQPNIVHLIGACFEVANPCLVEEFIEGETLYERLHSSLHRTHTELLADLAHYGKHVALALLKVHKNGLIHRDVKSPNVMIEAATNRAVLVDFGGAKEMIAATTDVMTAEAGTYRWMAPEMIQQKPYDNKVDVYGYGIILWEMLSRKTPFDQFTPLQAAFAVSERQVRPTIPSFCPPDLEKLIEACWHPEPEHRPSFAEIYAILPTLSMKPKKRGLRALIADLTE